MSKFEIYWLKAKVWDVQSFCHGISIFFFFNEVMKCTGLHVCSLWFSYLVKLLFKEFGCWHVLSLWSCNHGFSPFPIIDDILNCLCRKEIYPVCVYHVTIWLLVLVFDLETIVTIEFPFLMVLRRVASEHHLFTPLLMKLRNTIMSSHWMDCKIESIFWKE